VKQSEKKSTEAKRKYAGETKRKEKFTKRKKGCTIFPETCEREAKRIPFRFVLLRFEAK
jgi:hypothetical protein